MKKKNISLIIISIFIFFMNMHLAFTQTEYGSWVIPPYRMNFYSNGPVVLNNLTNPSNYTMSDAGFENNGNLYFYLVDNQIYDVNNLNIGSLTASSAGYQYEVEIIKVPGQLQKYYIIYGVFAPYTGKLWYATIDCTSGAPQIISDQALTSNSIENISFAITGLDNGTRTMYVARQYGNIGLEKYLINSSGISFVSTMVTTSDPVLNNASYFASHNMEINESENILAWCSSDAAFTEKIFIANLDANGNYVSGSIIPVNKGYICGIEFANSSGNNILYASCDGTTGGIQQINYITGLIGTPLTSNGNYGRTFLETAADGYIYAVSNSGDNLGRINPAINTFSPSVISQVNIKSSFVVGNTPPNSTLYKLPANKSVYSILGIEISSTNVSCPGYNDGTATATPLGGTPPYTYLWSPNGETTQTIENLTVGTYTCCITDFLDDEECLSVDVTLPINLFDYDQYNINYPVALNNWDKSFETELRIGPSGNVTMTDCDLQFGKYARILIEPGGKLTLNNCTVKEFTDCGDRWIGIEVQGNRDTIQTEAFQGKLVLNNSTIENANKAVLLAGTTLEGGIDFSKTGGIINATDADFINNNRSVSVYSYQNMNGTKEYDNVSSFIRCDFEVNSNYINDGTYYSSMVYMYGVRGISFKRCDFINSKNLSPYGKAIDTQNAGFKIDGLCPTGISPCDPADYPSTFTNFKKAILASANGSTRAISIRNSEFINNSTGIEFNLVTNPVVLFCDFQLGKPADDEQGECETEGKAAAAYGIDMAECTGFAIEENEFSKYTGVPAGNYIGIRCKDSQTPYDLIYKNTFDGLSYGNYAEGNNRSGSNDLVGLEFQCNSNTGNSVDFIVTTDDPQNPPQIRTHQGTMEMEAGNAFSTNVQTEGHFKNTGTQVINYFYNTNPPTDYTPWYVVPIDDAGENTCPSHYGGGGSGGGSGKSLVLSPSEKLLAEQDFVDNLADYNNVEALFNNLKDGGNTEALKTEVEMSWPQDMLELRAELLGKSPHLSKDVLMTAADKTDVLPESVLFEILSANPDELRKGELISYLENKEQPLPEYMISILRQLAGGITYKTILLQEMAKYNAAKTNAAYDLIRSCLNDTISDYVYLRNWLDNLSNINADMQIVSTYLAEGNYTSAQAMLDMIPGLYELEGEKLTEYNDYKSLTEMQINWQKQGWTVFELDSAEVATLIGFAENSNGKASVAAQGILEFAHGYNYCNCLPLNDTSAWKSTPAFSLESIADNSLFIEASPNPASTWVGFEYKLPVYAGEAILQVTDVKGNLITVFTLTNKQGQQVWDIRNIETGVYLYTLKAGGLSKSGKLIVD